MSAHNDIDLPQTDSLNKLIWFFNRREKLTISVLGRSPPSFWGNMEGSMLDEAKLLASDIMTRDVAVVHPESTLLAR